MNRLPDEFGSVVRQLRNELRWSQEVLAGRADINRSYLGEIERGAAVPSLVTIAKLARALNVRPSSLLERCERDS